jgi:hypothetical protein
MTRAQTRLFVVAIDKSHHFCTIPEFQTKNSVLILESNGKLVQKM